ncbi:Uma2 family endonuclease [Streptomyces laurentii]|uniref:Uma2 family endonuclease n=1 Tax=Streptomyces laurentii TaxID=39478 RepID=UPI0036958126
MSALAAEAGPEQGNGWDDLVRRWESMDWPEGCKVEIIEGIITVAPYPSGIHNDIADDVQQVLYPALRPGWGLYQTQPVAVPTRVGMFVPDLLVAPKKLVREAPRGLSAAEAELVVEITSPSNANHDRIAKAAGYASAGVPLYLLIDRWAPGGPTVTLFGEPRNAVYRLLCAVKFGERIHLPAPFDCTLDTAVFTLD